MPGNVDPVLVPENSAADCYDLALGGKVILDGTASRGNLAAALNIARPHTCTFCKMTATPGAGAGPICSHSSWLHRNLFCDGRRTKAISHRGGCTPNGLCNSGGVAASARFLVQLLSLQIISCTSLCSLLQKRIDQRIPVYWAGMCLHLSLTTKIPMYNPPPKVIA